jgi:hypothetical protein
MGKMGSSCAFISVKTSGHLKNNHRAGMKGVFAHAPAHNSGSQADKRVLSAFAT